MISIIIKGILLGLYLAIAVGPIVFTVLKVSMKYGHKSGYALVAGVSFSDIMFVIIGNVAASFLANLKEHKDQIGLVGGIILIIIGCYTLFLKKDPEPGPDNNIMDIGTGHLVKMFTQGFLMNTINPGPIIIWLTACTAASATPLYERIVMFSITLGIILSADILKVKLAGRIREKLTPKTLHLINRITAFILIGFGVAILLGLSYEHYETIHKSIK